MEAVEVNDGRQKQEQDEQQQYEELYKQAKQELNEDLYHQLKRPFRENKISWRVGATKKDVSNKPVSGIALAYVDARDVMERLDQVFGMDWQCRYTQAEKKTVCEIGVKINGEWIWRANAAGDSDIEAEKGAASDAFKRAAVLFGIGRYLYELPNVWMPLTQNKYLESKPSLPDWATPDGYDEIFIQRKIKTMRVK
jgi:hypothetical protein